MYWLLELGGSDDMPTLRSWAEERDVAVWPSQREEELTDKEEQRLRGSLKSPGWIFGTPADTAIIDASASQADMLRGKEWMGGHPKNNPASIEKDPGYVFDLLRIPDLDRPFTLSFWKKAGAVVGVAGAGAVITKALNWW